MSPAPRAGALAYDLVHFEAWPVLLAAVGVLAATDVAIQVALIWLAHIGFDRRSATASSTRPRSRTPTCSACDAPAARW